MEDILAIQQITLGNAEDGKSAYEAAIEGGLPPETTEEDFNRDLSEVPQKANQVDLDETNENLNETSVSAEQALLSVTEEITNRLATSLVELGYVQIQGGSIVVSSNVSPLSKLQITSNILSILYNNIPKAWINVNGNRSEFNIDEATISTLRMRNAQGVGTLGWVADENGHLKLKAV